MLRVPTSSRAKRPLLGAACVLTAALVAGCGSSSSYRTPVAKAASASNATSPTSPFLAGLAQDATVSSTVPANGDVNPYGLAVVTSGAGRLEAGNVLVSNFNDKGNEQGTGTTIDQITPAGKSTLFATITPSAVPGKCPGGVGLTTALSVLSEGYVVVGSLPTTNGKSATAKAGCLIVLNSAGKAVETIAGPKIEGPWDSTAVNHESTSTLYVSNVLSGGAAKGVHTVDNSTVVRIGLSFAAGHAPKVTEETVIADGIPWVDSAEALAVGPTGLALSSSGALYLADTLANKITAIPDAASRTTPAAAGGTTVSSAGKLHEPLGLALAPNGDILTTNAANGEIVETTPAGKQLSARQADPKNTPGSLFGLTLAPGGAGLLFVDDAENSLRELSAPTASAVVKEAHSASLAKAVLVDAQGRTLYALSGETATHLLCTSAACFAVWPPLTVSSEAELPKGASGIGARLGVLRRSNGALQVTVGGLPLYTYAGDHAAGEANGQGVHSFGGTWMTLDGSGQPNTQPASSSAPAGYSAY